MPPAPLPLNEPERLAALRSYMIPDAPHASRLDIFTRLAARACHTPMSLVSIVDEKWAYRKSAVGLPPGMCARADAVCAYTILAPASLTICEDLEEDERFHDNEYLKAGAPPIRFYAGAPLCNQDGMPLGALCVLDTKPRKADPEELGLLERLAAGVVATLEMYRGCEHDWGDGTLSRSRNQEPDDLPVSEWELMADWLAETHPECGRHVTDPWVPHYMGHYPKLVERLMIHAGQRVDLDCAIP